MESSTFCPSIKFNFCSTCSSGPPTNFQTTQVIGTGLAGPSGFEFAPDGRIFILQRTGEIKVYKNGQLLSQNFATLPSMATGDRGLIGIAFDPEFTTNKYVYFYYTADDQLNYLVRFNATGDVGTEGPFILFQTTSPSNWLHVGGSIRFGTDGKMYFAIGDNGNPALAQSLDNPYGKIHRINKDGSIPTDNPFYNNPTAVKSIWAYGFRNPWRFQFDSLSGQLFGGDVGDFTTEEVNNIIRGGNYGWSNCEGTIGNCTDTVPPIYSYLNDGEGSAVTGGPVYRASMFPQSYYGKYFFSDYGRGFIKTLSLDENGNSTGVQDFDLTAGSVVDLKVSPIDGSLYYITYYPGRMYKITYSTGNQFPSPNATADNTNGATNPFTVNFSSLGTTDPDNDPLSFDWNFGDGSTNSTLANPTHTFQNKGTYTVELTVSDGTNSSQAIPIIIQVGQSPIVTIATPAENSKYNAGDNILVNTSAIDGVGNDLSDANIKTEIVFHHNTHIHPYLGPLTGRAHTFMIANQNHEPSANTWYEIKVTATDESGLSTTKSVYIFPNKSNLNFTSNIPGLSILINGIPVVTNSVIQSVVGYIRQVSTSFLQVFNNKIYEWESWSNNAPFRHLLTTSANDATVSATFRESAPFTGEYFNNNNLLGTPVLTRQDPLIDFVWDDASPDPVVTPDNFSVRWTKTQHFEAGEYKFTVTSDDGARLYMDNNLVLDKWQQQSVPNEVTLNLTKGNHTLRLEYFEQTGGAIAKLSWDLTDTQPVPLVSNSYTAKYFNNLTLTGTPILTRQEETINNDWGQGSPDPVVPVNNFSTQWTQSRPFTSGVYRFTIVADDGVRLWVNNQKVLDKWIDQAPTAYTVDVSINNDNVNIPIVLEYYEKGGGAVAKMSYTKISSVLPSPTPTPLPNSGFNAEYWNTPTALQSPNIPTTPATLTRIDPEINFTWDGLSPAPTIDNDHFVARWTKTTNFLAGNYTFKAIADDGIRVYVDNDLIIDQWQDQPLTEFTASKDLTAGNHTIKVEYYENAGGAVAKFSYLKNADPVLPDASPFNAKYWNITPGSSPLIPQTTPTLERIDNELNFEWNDGSPDPLVNNQNFIAVWTKTQEFIAGTYEFTSTSDDGMRVYIDNDLIIDEWTDHATKVSTAQKTLTAGNHNIKVEYYENGGGAIAKFNYQKVTAPAPLPETFDAEYFNNKDLTGTPAVTRKVKQINFNWGMGSPDSLIPVDLFSARFTKTKDFTEGDYTFTITADDGVRFYIDDQLLLNEWADHPAVEFPITKQLTAGPHTLRIEYFENTGQAKLVFN